MEQDWEGRLQKIKMAYFQSGAMFEMRFKKIYQQCYQVGEQIVFDYKRMAENKK